MIAHSDVTSHVQDSEGAYTCQAGMNNSSIQRIAGQCSGGGRDNDGYCAGKDNAIDSVASC